MFNLNIGHGLGITPSKKLCFGLGTGYVSGIITETWTEIVSGISKITLAIKMRSPI